MALSPKKIMEKRHYEILFILRPADEEKITGLVDQFSSVLTKDGEIERLEQWGLRQLAYAIQDHRRGFYVLINTFCPSAAMDELQELFRFNNDVLRFMIMRCRKEQKGESSMLRNIREAREAQFQARRPGGARPKKEDSATGPDAPAEVPSIKEIDQSGEDIDPDAIQWDETPPEAQPEKTAPAPEKEAVALTQEQDDDAVNAKEAADPKQDDDAVNTKEAADPKQDDDAVNTKEAADPKQDDDPANAKEAADLDDTPPPKEDKPKE